MGTKKEEANERAGSSKIHNIAAAEVRFKDDNAELFVNLSDFQDKSFKPLHEHDFEPQKFYMVFWGDQDSGEHGNKGKKKKSGRFLPARILNLGETKDDIQSHKIKKRRRVPKLHYDQLHSDADDKQPPAKTAATTASSQNNKTTSDEKTKKKGVARAVDAEVLKDVQALKTKAGPSIKRAGPPQVKRKYAQSILDSDSDSGSDNTAIMVEERVLADLKSSMKELGVRVRKLESSGRKLDKEMSHLKKKCRQLKDEQKSASPDKASDAETPPQDEEVKDAVTYETGCAGEIDDDTYSDVHVKTIPDVVTPSHEYENPETVQINELPPQTTNVGTTNHTEPGKRKKKKSEMRPSECMAISQNLDVNSVATLKPSLTCEEWNIINAPLRPNINFIKTALGKVEDDAFYARVTCFGNEGNRNKQKEGSTEEKARIAFPVGHMKWLEEILEKRLLNMKYPPYLVEVELKKIPYYINDKTNTIRKKLNKKKQAPPPASQAPP